MSHSQQQKIQINLYNSMSLNISKKNMDTHVSPITVHDVQKRAKLLPSLLVDTSSWVTIDHNRSMHVNVSVTAVVMVSILLLNMSHFHVSRGV